MARTEVNGRQIKDKSVSLADDVVDVLPVANGGSGVSTIPSGSVLLGAGANPVEVVYPGTSGNLLTSNGSTWVSSPPAVSGGAEPAITAGTTGQYWRGDKTWQALNAAAVGLENVENTAAATAATASTIAKRDANGGLTSNRLITGFGWQSATSITLTTSSPHLQLLNPLIAATVTLPYSDVSGFGFQLWNISTYLVTVKDSTGGTVCTLPSGTRAAVVSNSTNAWLVDYNGTLAASNKRLLVNNSLTLAGTDNTTMTFPSTSGNVVTESATQTISGKTISGANNTITNIAQGSVTSLTTDLAAKVDASLVGAANGVASLDVNGKVPGAQLPNSIMTYEGLHNASTNSPALTDASGSAGQVYRISVGGTRNYGSGNVTTSVGDYLIHSGSVWEKADTTDAVSSVAGRTGDITLTTADVSGSVSLTGLETLTQKTLTNPTINGYTEGVLALGTVGSTATLSIADDTVITATLTANTACTFTMPSVGAGKSFTLFLKQAATTGNGTATFTGVKWSATGTPVMTATAGRMDIFTFFSDGTNWYGSAAQGYTP